MKVSLYSTDEKCSDLGTVQCAHISMFAKGLRIKLTFICVNQQLAFVKLCIKHYILIEIQGHDVTLVPEPNNFQRVRFKFDS